MVCYHYYGTAKRIAKKSSVYWKRHKVLIHIRQTKRKTWLFIGVQWAAELFAPALAPRSTLGPDILTHFSIVFAAELDLPCFWHNGNRSSYSKINGKWHATHMHDSLAIECDDKKAHSFALTALLLLVIIDDDIIYWLHSNQQPHVKKVISSPLIYAHMQNRLCDWTLTAFGRECQPSIAHEKFRIDWVRSTAVCVFISIE